MSKKWRNCWGARHGEIRLDEPGVAIGLGRGMVRLVSMNADHAGTYSTIFRTY